MAAGSMRFGRYGKGEGINMNSGQLMELPIEYLWEGLVLKNDIFNHTGAVMLLPEGETITAPKLNRLMRFYGKDKYIMVYEDTYLDIMTDEHAPLNARQEMTERYMGYTKLHRNIGSIFQTPNLDSWLNSTQMEPLVEAISAKLVQFDPIMILSCINFPRPMDEGLQRHSLNVALLNGIQAEWLKLPPEDVKTFTLAGLLHDIGKTMIPEEILNAPRRLTDEELEIMRKHPLYSDRLLGSKFSDSVRLAARHHHEKLNGRGYPDGLQDDEINLCARVTAISDIYDAMVSARSYKGARLPLNVLDMFYKEEFDGLDRGLVMRFLKNMRLKYTNKTVIMSDGERGIIRYIPPNDAEHPIVQQDELIRQADENWYCREMAAIY